ncbi:MAG: cadmium-translocating P-type ATPase [Bacteroidales bacterium]|nr:cadmium-translocating P-type ATPase [Bacteroidales bacterium]
MEKENKERLVKIVASGVLLVAAVVVTKVTDLRIWQQLLIFLIPYLIVGGETLKEAGEKLIGGELLDEDFLMSVATLGALGIGFLPGAETQFPEAVFVMLFFQVGELFEDMAEDRSRESITKLMDIRPDSANVERDGIVLTVSPSEIAVGETIVIKPGEKVPLDGVITEGSSSLDTVALTGESVPRSVGVDDIVLSGCVNLSGVLRASVTKPFGESTASKILELVENASESKSKSESFITRFAKVYTPIVVAAAILLAFLPPLFSGNFGAEFGKWLYRALTFLIVSCPCALVISIPLAFFGGIGGASRKGILVKGANYLEALSKVGTVVFDKTGTLTEGVFEVTAVHPEIIEEKELLHLAAHVERYSSHPVAISLRNAYPEEADNCSVEDVKEVAGQGVKAIVNGKTVCVGNSKMMEAEGAGWKECYRKGTIVHVCMDGEYMGHIVVSDRIKQDAAEAVAALKRNGVNKTVMLTGDKEDVAATVAVETGVDEYKSGLLPNDKVAEVEKLMADKKEGSSLAFVGDGINDAPVLARADVGIAMGALGSDAAIEAADVVLMDDKPSKLTEAIKVARKTIRIAKQNTVFSISVKVLVLLLAMAGLAAMWMAVLADVGVMVLAVLNSTRALRA